MSSCGTVVNWIPERGFGFIDFDGLNIFVHVSDLELDREALSPGETVTFDIMVDDTGRHRAENVKGHGMQITTDQIVQESMQIMQDPTTGNWITIPGVASKKGAPTTKHIQIQLMQQQQMQMLLWQQQQLLLAELQKNNETSPVQSPDLSSSSSPNNSSSADSAQMFIPPLMLNHPLIQRPPVHSSPEINPLAHNLDPQMKPPVHTLEPQAKAPHALEPQIQPPVHTMDSLTLAHAEIRSSPEHQWQPVLNTEIPVNTEQTLVHSEPQQQTLVRVEPQQQTLVDLGPQQQTLVDLGPLQALVGRASSRQPGLSARKQGYNVQKSKTLARSERKVYRYHPYGS